MKRLSKTKISCAVCMAIAALDTQMAFAEIETIEVTATRRSESIQTVPISVQALGEETLKQNNISKFEDYIDMLPSVAVSGRGPGQNEVYIRGIALDHNGINGAEFTPSPTVGFYLDDQPITAAGRNLDVYITDVERLEVLAGPQGTLFGASAQAGAIRIITNKPDASSFSAGATVDYSKTKGGDDSHSVEGFVNIPIIEDELAVRITGYHDVQGGYIDNVFGTFTLDPSVNPNPNPDFFNGGDISQGIQDQWLSATYTEVDNSEFVEDDFNDSKYAGVRIGLMWEPTEDLSILVQHTHQALDVDGVFDYDPEVGELEVTRFDEDSLDDDFDLTTWTIEKRMDMLDIVYTGGYLDREVFQTIDYIGYNNSGAFAGDYYTCTYAGIDYGLGLDPSVRHCLDPNKRFVGDIGNERNTHELRISTPADNKVSAVVGLFYDDQTITHDGEYDYAAAPDLGFFPNRPNEGATANNPDFREPGVTFINDLTREEKQKALFGELSWNITDQITATFGLRYYELEATFLGSSAFANTAAFGATEDFPDYGRTYDIDLADATPLEQDGTIVKFTLDYQMTKDVLLYTTYSEGYRPGGFNRSFGPASNPNDLPEFRDFVVPAIYETDDVINMEFGWKTTLNDGNLRFNGAIYHIDWEDVQVAVLDTANISNLTFTSNVANAKVKGIEMDLAWTATDNLTLFGAVTYNDTEITELTSGLSFVLAPEGSELALSPALQYSLRGRYDWEVNGDIEAYAQMSMNYTDDSYNSMYLAVRERQDDYTIANAAVGATFDEWGVELYIDNLTDELAEKNINLQDDIRRITTNRPRTVGVRFFYDFY